MAGELLTAELLIAGGLSEWRAAWLQDGTAVELYVERGDVRPVGSIQLGRVLRRSAGLEAVFVDIGEARPGFLPISGAGPDPDEGARLLVQVRREAQRGKGALLSTRIEPRQGADPAVLREEAARLDPPAQLAPTGGFGAALAQRLPGAPARVLTDDRALLRELREAFPAAEIALRDAAEWPLDIDVAIEAALSPTLALPGGGGLHIEETRAAVLIDVDTGTPERGSAERAALAVNLAAAAAIARQLRLRQLAGGIVVDFAALDGRGPRERVHQALAVAIEGDPAQPRILGWTRLGHLEIVRPRRGRPLSEAMLEPQSRGKSATAVAFEALRALQREARARPAANWRLAVRPAVESVLRGTAATALRELEARLGRSIVVEADAALEDRGFDISAL